MFLRVTRILLLLFSIFCAVVLPHAAQLMQLDCTVLWLSPHVSTQNLFCCGGATSPPPHPNHHIVQATYEHAPTPTPPASDGFTPFSPLAAPLLILVIDLGVRGA